MSKRRAALKAQLDKAFEEGQYELYAELQEQLKSLPDEMESSCAAPEEEGPLTNTAKLQTIANMIKKSLAVGRETMKVSRDHGQTIPASVLARMIQAQSWQKKIKEALATRDGPLFKHLTDSTRQVNKARGECNLHISQLANFHSQKYQPKSLYRR